jgi:UDP-glucose 4-epimerase
MKAVVFGGSGFLGSHVADELTRSGHLVTVFDKTPSKYLHGDQKMIQGDILDEVAVRAATKGQDVVYNFAGLADLNVSIERPKETLELNVMGNLNILEAARACQIKRYLYASTVYVFSKQGSFYGISKYASEKVVEEFSHQHDMDFTILRYGSVYGPRCDEKNRIYRLLKEALQSGKIVFQGNGEEEREYIHVRDAAKLSVRVLHAKYKNRHIMLTGTERYRYSDLLQMISEILNHKIKIVYLNENYNGHYVRTPYSFSPTVSHKLVANPFTDFGQGLLETIEEINAEMGTLDMIEEQPLKRSKGK